jgi:glucokinase
MTEPSLVGDIGGTNSRFGLVHPGATAVTDIEKLKNDGFATLEAAIQHYLKSKNISKIGSAAVAVAAPVDREVITLTNRDWSFSSESLRAASHAKRFRLLNDYEALALSLPHLEADDVVQIGGVQKRGLKVVMGPGTGLGMAALAPLPNGGWLPVPGEMGHITLPVVTAEELALKDKIVGTGKFAEVEDVLTGPGLFALYRAIAAKPLHATPEAVLQSAIKGGDAVAEKTLDHFATFLARLAGDAAMGIQARGGVYLAGGIAPSIVDWLKRPKYRAIFEDKGRISDVMKPIPLYVIVDLFPAFKGCAAAAREVAS